MRQGLREAGEGEEMNDNYCTPLQWYMKLDREFHFNDDPCPVEGENGLDRDWGTSTFVNPPYSKPYPWVKKAYDESLRGKTIVMLLKCDTSTKWFHEYALPHAEIRYIKGRIRFGKYRAPFPSVIIIFHATEKERTNDRA